MKLELSGKVHRSEEELNYDKELEKYFDNACGTTIEKLNEFPKFVPRQSLSRLLFRYELMKIVLTCHGSILELGVRMGGGTMTFANISAILEPYNYQRMIFGFDTFEGFVEVTDEDLSTESGRNRAKVGTFKVEGNITSDLARTVKLFDMNRPVGHIEKVKFFKGDVTESIPAFLEEHPETVISLLYIDMDLYKPTRDALKALILRIPKGGVIAFDELNSNEWPGETRAVMEVLGLNNIKLQRFPFVPGPCYAILE